MNIISVNKYIYTFLSLLKLALLSACDVTGVTKGESVVRSVLISPSFPLNSACGFECVL